MRRGESVAIDESAVLAEPFLDSIVVEDSESDGCLPDPTCADESDRRAALSEANDPLDQLVASETGPWWRGRQFTKKNTFGM